MSKTNPFAEPIAFGIVNDDGFWTGIWKDRGTAQEILTRGQLSHKEIIIPIAPWSSMLVDAMEIADSCTRADIECESPAVEMDGRRWHDISCVAECAQDMVARAERYLIARDLLERHAEHPGLVRFKNG